MRRRLPSEARLVEHLAGAFATRRRDVVVGIGDDAALVRPGVDGLVATVDVLVEAQDFTRASDPRRLGRKALSVNLSDLAAMGATPLYALLVLGLPKTTPLGWFERFVDGVRDAATEHGVAVVGGDLSASGVLFASITAPGRAPERPLTRAGARPGDGLYVSGTLGAAAAGLRLLSLGYAIGPDGKARTPGGRKIAPPRSLEIARLIRHQVDPRPMVELGRTLAEKGLASSAIDVSDGLVRDLHRLCRASGIAATLEEHLVPVDSALRDLDKVLELDAKETALRGGEDFALLFTVPERAEAAIARLTPRFALRRIGTMREEGLGGRVALSRGNERLVPLADTGFDHFGEEPA